MTTYGRVKLQLNLFLTSTLYDSERSLSRLGRSTPVPTELEAWWAPQPVWTLWRSDNSRTSAANRTH